MAASGGDDERASNQSSSPSRARLSHRYSDGDGNARDPSIADVREFRENGDRRRDGYARDSNRARDRFRDDFSHDKRRRDDRDCDKYDRHCDRSSRRREDGERGEKWNYQRRHEYDRERRPRHPRSRSHSPGRAHEHSSPSRDRRSKRTSGFDMAAPGSTGTTLAAISGLLPSTASGVGNSLQALGTIPGMGSALPGVFPTIFPFSGGTQATRHARRVYVGGLPLMANEQNIAAFFSQVMAAVGGNTAGPGDAVVNVYINQEKRFAFVEMRTVEEASNAMALDGIMYEGAAVRVRRPTDYNPSMAAILGPSQPSPHLNLAAVGLIPGVAGAVDGPDRIFVGGLPHYLTDEQAIDLLSSFGALRAFELVKDRDTGISKGYAFCVYQDSAVIDTACTALNGLKMGDRTLTVRRASASGQPKPDQTNIMLQAQQQIAMQKLALESSVNSMSFGNLGFFGSGIFNNQLPGLSSIAQTEAPSRIICLSKVVSLDELNNDTAYDEILEDMRDECGKYGNLAGVVIPRPIPTQQVPGVGKVFVEYKDAQGALKAKTSLNGRMFGGNAVIASYYSEAKFFGGDYGG